jgi:hypothetical protein
VSHIFQSDGPDMITLSTNILCNPMVSYLLCVSHTVITDIQALNKLTHTMWAAIKRKLRIKIPRILNSVFYSPMMSFLP